MRLITLLSVLMETEVDVTSQFRLNGSRMNRVELDEALHGQPKWAAFAEADGPDPDLLTFNQKDQVFEFAVDPAKHLPAAWKIANKIDVFLNPNLKRS